MAIVELYPDFLSQDDLVSVFRRHVDKTRDVFRNAVMGSLSKNQTINQKLACMLADRVYTEWATDRIMGSGNLSPKEKPDYKNGLAFSKWLLDEQQYAAERKNSAGDLFTIENACVRSALDFFEAHCSYGFVLVATPYGEINIRRSLRPWIDNPNLVTIWSDTKVD